MIYFKSLHCLSEFARCYILKYGFPMAIPRLTSCSLHPSVSPDMFLSLWQVWCSKIKPASKLKWIKKTQCLWRTSLEIGKGPTMRQSLPVSAKKKKAAFWVLLQVRFTATDDWHAPKPLCIICGNIIAWDCKWQWPKLDVRGNFISVNN